MNISDFEKKISGRDDYLREAGDEDCCLFNSKWKILSSFALIPNSGPCILTCQEHDGGTNLFIIHPCRWRNCLPSNIPDQVCQAVIKPRMIRSIQTYKWTHGYGMFYQGGSFNGIDTCSMTNFVKFGFDSPLLNEAEARSIVNRPEINECINQLAK